LFFANIRNNVITCYNIVFAAPTSGAAGVLKKAFLDNL